MPATTRQEIQTAQDIIKSANVCQDLLNVAAKLARGEITKIVEVSPGVVEEQPMALGEIKAGLARQMDNVTGYTQQAARYLGVSANRTSATNGLRALGLDLAAIEADLQGYAAKVAAVRSALTLADAQPKLDAIGDGIDKDIPSLNLLRNA